MISDPAPSGRLLSLQSGAQYWQNRRNAALRRYIQISREKFWAGKGEA